MPSTLLYHDVVPLEEADSSGFAGGDATRYKLTPAEFRQHLDTLARSGLAAPVLAPDLVRGAAGPGGWLLTFDDGGRSAARPTAELLEERGWRGHFFVTTDYLGTPTFLSAEEARALHERGHVIGSHSCSHPPRMAKCSWEQLLDEWQRSRDVLGKVLGEPPITASIPGGYYSHAVARAAARAGYRVLFTSEPTTRPWTVEGCLVLGRYTVYRGQSPARAAALAQGKLFPRLQQALMWKLKKMAKALGGGLYLSVRKRLLDRAYGQDPR
jgi:peptidoglycan/xylan/chitin deacetylase (PgdA/CDA1 family)